MNQGIEGVPDEEDTEFGCRGGGKEAVGEEVGGEEDEESGEEGEDCGGIDHGVGGGQVGRNVHGENKSFNRLLLLRAPWHFPNDCLSYSDL